MSFDSIKKLKKQGFEGFISIEDLNKDRKPIPPKMGIYIILKPSKQNPSFLKNGPAGHIAGKNPNKSLIELREKWVANTIVLYIGKAGAPDQKANLNGRLNQYLRHGRGHSARHWGGRYIWQLKNSKDLIVCWKLTTTSTPRETEKELIELFFKKYSKLPFANLTN